MADTRTPLMAGNWKSNLNHQEAVVLVQKLAWTLDDKKHDYARVEVVVVPPFTDIRSVQTLVDGDRLQIKYGAQDVSEHDGGAYTGEISAAMLAKLGCSYVVVGHSERREYHGETDDLVNTKAHKALDAGMTPIVCVGERLEVRQAGEHAHAHAVIRSRASLAGFTPEQVAGLVIAYEPVWAIGTGEVATPDDAQEVCAAIRGQVPRDLRRRGGGRRTHPLRRLGEGRQRGRDHGRGRRRRLPGRRRQPAGRRVRRDLPLLRHAGAVNTLSGDPHS